jgi:hypothetical protein
MSCSALLTAGCADKQYVAQTVKPDPVRLQCVAAAPADRPKLPAEHVIDWSQIRTVAEAKAEHLRFVSVVRSREGAVAGYILRIEGQLFTCSDNAAWLRDFYAALPGEGASP